MSERRRLTNQHIAVTGGAGFVGSHIVDRLVPDNEVHVFDNLTTGTRRNVPEPAILHEKDVKDLQAADLAGVDVVFHQAANVSISRSVEDPVFDANENVVGLVRTLEAAREADVDRVLFASSSAVYGTPDRLPVSEEQSTDPESPYAASKCAGEAYCRAYDSMYDVDVVRLRYFNVYGPRQRGDSPYAGVIAIFVDRLLEGDTLTIHGDGTQTRDFVYVDDVVEANLLAAMTDDVGGGVYNVGTGDKVSINELADELESVVGLSPGRVYDDPRPGDVDRSQADIEKIRSDMDYSPGTDLTLGLSQTVQCYEHEYNTRSKDHS